MKKDKRKKEEIAEDYCFVCKDGGHLRVCDFKNCLKAYHPLCADKDQTFLETDERWTCSWHSCFICQKGSNFQCFCCPYSVCRGCMKAAQFVQVRKRTKGFCNNCLKLAILIEENVDIDSDGDKVDFQDTTTFEFLFKDYWEIVKDQERLTLIDLHAADALLKSGENCKSGSDSDKLLEEELMAEEDDMEDTFENGISLFKRLKGKLRGKKTSAIRSSTKKKTFIGWGSEDLIDFLNSIGKDTKEPLTQLDISEIIKDYIQVNNLFHPDKKKKKSVICDERLHSLFRKKKIKLYKIYNLLENHLAANADLDDEISFSSDEGDNPTICKKQRRIHSDSKVKPEPNHFKRKVLEPPKSDYAALVEKNIKSVYLRKSLVLKFLKDLESLENKVTGCFVRVKSDPKDFYFSPHKFYQLGLVKGIKKAPHAYKIGETSTDIVLCISNMWKDIQISLLSDDDFEEEECEDLCQLVKKGLLKRPTIAELDKKIKSVHEDIMNHWIDREIVRLQRMIDRANEKGWRGELFAYIEQRELLCTPSERNRLIQEVPSVIADTEGELDANTSTPLSNHEEYQGRHTAAVEAPIQDVEGGHGAGLEDTVWKGEGGHEVEVPAQEVEGGHEVEVPAQEVEGNGASYCERTVEREGPEVESIVPRAVNMGNGCGTSENVVEDVAGGSSDVRAAFNIQRQLDFGTEEPKSSSANGMRGNGEFIEIEEDVVVLRDKVASDIQIIDLDDDDDGEDASNPLKGNDPSPEDTRAAFTEAESQKVWHYMDPSGQEQGPFTLAALRLWRESGYFGDDFKVWRAGESEIDAVFLMDALGLTSS